MLGERRLRSSSRSTTRQSNTDASASGHPSPFAPVDINIKVAATSTQIPSLHTPSSSSQNAVTNMSEKIMTRSATRRSHATETDVVEKAQPLRQSRGKGRMQTDDKAIALEEGPHDQVNIILTRSRSRTSFRSRRSSVTPFSDRPSQASKERSVLKDRSRNSSVVSKQSRSRTASLTPRQSPVTFKRKHALQEEDFLSLNFATPGKKSQPQSREATPSSRATRRRRKYTHEALDGELLVSQDLEYNTDRRESPNRAAGHKSAINNSFSAEATRHIISDVDMSELNTQTNSSTVPVKPVAVKGVPSFLESEDEFADNGNNAAFNRARVQTGGAFSLFGNNGGSVFKMATPVSSKSFTAFRADGISPSDDEDEFWKSPPAKMQIGRSILPPSGSTSGSTSRSSSKRTSPVPYSAHKSTRSRTSSVDLLSRSAPSIRGPSPTFVDSWWMAKPVSSRDQAARRNLFGIVRQDPPTPRTAISRSKSFRPVVATGSPGSQWKVAELATWMENQGLNSPVTLNATYHPKDLADMVRQRLKGDSGLLSASSDEDGDEMLSDSTSEAAVDSVDLDGEIVGRFPASIVAAILKNVLVIGQTEALLPSLFVNKSWARITQQVLWSSPRFFSLNAMMRMHRIIYGAVMQTGAASAGPPTVEAMRGHDINGLRGMLGIVKTNLLDPKCFLFSPQKAAIRQDDSVNAIECPTPNPEGFDALHNLELARRVRSLSFHLFNPGDRRFPLSFDVQSFIADGLPHLREIKIMGSPDWVDSFLISRMASNSSLRSSLEVLELHAGAAERISRDALVVHLGRFHGLKRLVLGGSLALTDDALKSVAIGCRNLVTLALWRCPIITDFGITNIVERCKDLRTLEIGHCPGVSDRLLSAMANTEHLSIHTLSLCYLSATKVSQVALINLLAPVGSASSPKIAKLVLNGFPGLTVDGIALIATRQAATLRYLTVHDGPCLAKESPNSLRIFLGFLSHVRLLDLSGCFSACKSDWERKEKIEDMKSLARVLGLERGLTVS